MDEQTQYLLSDYDKKLNHWALDEYKRQFDHYEAQWLLIGKYYGRLWFQLAMRKSESELLLEYKQLAALLYDLEATINECRTKLHQHFAAVENLHSSMKPYSKIDMSNVALVQAELF